MTHDDDVDQALNVATTPVPVEPLMLANLAVYRHGHGRVIVVSVPQADFTYKEHVPPHKWVMIRRGLPPELRKLLD